ncbi:hypothetical protein AAFF_G00326950 [Aldrovandia affinis]|uniref:Uncharacterized protein n=1 Tax=Aldrovandia affinis TaxID=143900 RepID=A0AAD7X1C7_9TELE|nr:hypothetical protein AAFF_G00326950 [Aldrovandia affinis]
MRKTKEDVIDFRRKKEPVVPVYIQGTDVEMVRSYRSRTDNQTLTIWKPKSTSSRALAISRIENKVTLNSATWSGSIPKSPSQSSSYHYCMRLIT